MQTQLIEDICIDIGSFYWQKAQKVRENPKTINVTLTLNMDGQTDKWTPYRVYEQRRAVNKTTRC